jgi:uncharacterized membrane protein
MPIPSQTRARLVWRVGAAAMLIVIGMVCINFLLTVYSKYRLLDSDAYNMFLTRRGWLWTHLAGGALTITFGLVQFLTQWPQPYPRLHRWTGRIYMTGLLIASVGATGLLATSLAPLGIRIAFTATALAWLTTALTGLIAIRKGQIRPHRRWMVRNFLVTVSPITFRALLAIPGVMSLAPPPVMIAILLWTSWLLPLMVCELTYRMVDRTGLHPNSSSMDASPKSTDLVKITT